MTRKILIVDDNTSSNETLSNIIACWGDFEVDTATNGEQALENCTRDFETWRQDIDTRLRSWPESRGNGSFGRGDSKEVHR